MAFNPNSSDALSSVGQDGAVRFWDARSPKKAVAVCRVGFGKLYCVGSSPSRPNQLTGER